jgi:hypothetical protein
MTVNDCDQLHKGARDALGPRPRAANVVRTLVQAASFEDSRRGSAGLPSRERWHPRSYASRKGPLPASFSVSSCDLPDSRHPADACHSGRGSGGGTAGTATGYASRPGRGSHSGRRSRQRRPGRTGSRAVWSRCPSNREQRAAVWPASDHPEISRERPRPIRSAACVLSEGGHTVQW